MSETLEIIVAIIISVNLLILYLTYNTTNFNGYKVENLEKQIKNLENSLEIEKSRRRQCEKIIARGRR